MNCNGHPMETFEHDEGNVNITVVRLPLHYLITSKNPNNQKNFYSVSLVPQEPAKAGSFLSRRKAKTKPNMGMAGNTETRNP